MIENGYSVIASSSQMELAREDNGNLVITANLGYLNDYNKNNVALLYTDFAEESIKTIINRPIKGKLRRDIFGNEKFGSHEAYVDENGEMRFATETIGTHIDANIVNLEVIPVHGDGSKKVLPTIIAKAVIWADEYPEYANAVERLYREGRLGTSWEVIGRELGDDLGRAKELMLENPRAYSKFEIRANTIIGVEPAYGVNSRIIDVAEDTNADEILFSALKKDISAKSDKYGIGSKIAIDKSVESASNKPWGEVDKTSLRNRALLANNYVQLVNFIYLDVQEGWEESPSTKLGYPVAEIIGDKAVYNINGIQSALSFLRNTNTNDNPKVESKLKSLYKKFNLDMDNFSSENNKDRSNYMEERLKELENELAEANKKLSEYENANKDAELASLKEELDVLREEKSSVDEKFISTTEKLEALTSELEELKSYKEKYDEIQAQKQEEEKQLKISELKEMVTKGGFVKEEELETSEELKTMIDNLDEAGLKVFRAERILSSVEVSQDEKNKKEKEKMEFSEKTVVDKNAMDEFLSK